MKLYLFAYLILVATFSINLGFSQSSVHESVDSLFLTCGANTPGYAIGIVYNGKIDYMKGYGMANLEYSIPILPSTPFHLASVSKQFTAFCIYLLAEQGKLRLTDTVQKYLPEFPHYPFPVTILSLLQHTSGLRDQWELLGLSGIAEPDLITQQHVLNIIYRQTELNFKPGDKWLYSNSNYSLLAQIIEQVSGKKFSDFIKQNLFSPLQMRSSFINDDAKRIIPLKASSYQSENDTIYKKMNLNYSSFGATDMWSTIEDLLKWLLNFDALNIGSKKIFDNMTTKAVLNNGDTASYASGLFVGKYKGLDRMFHDGNDAGYQTYVGYFPEKKFGIIVLSNNNAANPAQIAMKITNYYLKFHEDQAGKVAGVLQYRYIKTNIEKWDWYIGNYETPGGNLIKILKGDTNLLIQFPDMDSPVGLKEVDDTNFIVFNNYKITFSEKGLNQFKKIKLASPTFSNHADKVEYVNYTTSQLKQFTGYYYSNEVNTVYEVAIIDNKIVLWHMRNGEIALIPKTKDRFSADKWYLSRILFERNKKNEIVSFRISSDRVYNLIFRRISW